MFPHKDVDAARAILRELPAGQRKLLITDGVFSMDGDLGALPELCALAREFGCIMMVDDAHASGVFGKQRPRDHRPFRRARAGRHPGGHAVEGNRRAGGYVAGSRALIDFLHHRARPFLFSTSHPPAVAAACIAAIDVLLKSRRSSIGCGRDTRFFKAGLQALGFDTGASESPITPVIVGEGPLAMTLSDRLFDEGVFAGDRVSDRPRAARRVRTIVTATHARSCSSRSTCSATSAASLESCIEALHARIRWLLLRGARRGGGGARRADLQGQASEPDGVRDLLKQVEQTLQTGNREAFVALLSGAADEMHGREFAESEISRAPCGPCCRSANGCRSTTCRRATASG